MGEAHAGRLLDHVHLRVADLDASRRFYEGALEPLGIPVRGGTESFSADELPGERTYHPGYYAAFVLDPDGNNVEAVYHGPVERSAPSVVFTWDEPD